MILDKNRIMVAAHRGDSARYAENTVLAFEKALALGVDNIETDVRKSKDGKLFLIHDATLERTTDGAGDVHGFTYAELKKFDAGKLRAPGSAGQRIPLFTDLLDLCKNKEITLNIEIKDNTFEVVDEAVKLALQYFTREQFVIACFDARIVEYAWQKHNVLTQGFTPRYFANHSQKTYTCMHSVGIHHPHLTPELCNVFKALNIRPWAWAQDTAEMAEHAIACGVELMTCNDPVPALRVLGRIK